MIRRQMLRGDNDLMQVTLQQFSYHVSEMFKVKEKNLRFYFGEKLKKLFIKIIKNNDKSSNN